MSADRFTRLVTCALELIDALSDAIKFKMLPRSALVNEPLADRLASKRIMMASCALVIEIPADSAASSATISASGAFVRVIEADKSAVTPIPRARSADVTDSDADSWLADNPPDCLASTHAIGCEYP
jgi:hypothetical protein